MKEVYLHVNFMYSSVYLGPNYLIMGSINLQFVVLSPILSFLAKEIACFLFFIQSLIGSGIPEAETFGQNRKFSAFGFGRRK